MDDKLSVQQKLTFTLFLLNISWRLFDFGKCLSNKMKNFFSYIGGDISAEWWVKPNDISMACSL